MPNATLYYKNWDEWLEFFSKLGMLNSPKPQDILDFVDTLIKKAQRSCGDTVAESCIDILKYINSHWEDLENAKVDDGKATLTDALNKRAWLPVEISPRNLQQYPAALIPENRLYSSSTERLK